MIIAKFSLFVMSGELAKQFFQVLFPFYKSALYLLIFEISRGHLLDRTLNWAEYLLRRILNKWIKRKKLHISSKIKMSLKLRWFPTITVLRLSWSMMQSTFMFYPVFQLLQAFSYYKYLHKYLYKFSRILVISL